MGSGSPRVETDCVLGHSNGAGCLWLHLILLINQISECALSPVSEGEVAMHSFMSCIGLEMRKRYLKLTFQRVLVDFL